MTGTSWRDRIKVHPASEMFPVLSGEELAALAKDIAENGLQQAVVLWTPEQIGLNPPTQVHLLDGRKLDGKTVITAESIDQLIAALPAVQVRPV